MGCNFWSLKEQLMWNDIQEQFQWESNKFHGNLIENTWGLTKHFYGMGCNFWSLKEQLMWNDIQEQFHWK